MRFRQFLEMSIDWSARGLGDEYASHSASPFWSHTKRYLTKHNKKITGYHATYVENFWNILQQGVTSRKDRKRHSVSYDRTTYWGHDPSIAKSFAPNDDYIIFVAEIPGPLTKGSDDIWHMTMTAKSIPPQHLVGVIYPPNSGQVTDLKSFIREVQEGKYPKIPPRPNIVPSVGEATPPDIENYVAHYVNDLIKGADIDPMLMGMGSSGRLRTQLVSDLPAYEQMRDWHPRDFVPFLQKISDRSRRWRNSIFKDAKVERFKLDPAVFNKFPDIPLHQAIQRYTER